MTSLVDPLSDPPHPIPAEKERDLSPAHPNPSGSSSPTLGERQPSRTPSMRSQNKLKSTEEEDDMEEARAERRLVWKLDLWILPFIALLYLFAFLDRGNIGNARLQGLEAEVLNNDDGHYQWALSIFYFGYVIFELPANLALRVVRPGAWIAGTMVVWGIISTLTSVTTNYAGLLVVRFFLGMGEAAFAPGLPLYISMWYTRDELGIRNGMWIGSAALAGAFGGLIAYGVSKIQSSISTWKFLFIIEGIPAVLLGVVAFFFLPDRPGTTKRLSPFERALAKERVNREVNAGRGEKVGEPKVSWRNVRKALLDYKMWILAVIYTGLNVALSSISVFLPTIIRDLGYSNSRAQLLTVPPYAVAYVVLVITCITSDRTFDRGLHMTILCVIGCAGYLMLFLSTSSSVRYGATFLALVGVFPNIPLAMTWVANSCPNETVRAVEIAVVSSFAQAFAVLGTHIYPNSEGPRYKKGHIIVFGFMCLSGVLSLLLHLILKNENKRRDKLYGKVVRTRGGRGKIRAAKVGDGAEDDLVAPRSPSGAVEGKVDEKGVEGRETEVDLRLKGASEKVSGGSGGQQGTTTERAPEQDAEYYDDPEDDPTFRYAC